LQKLHENKFDAYLVGGCVRDLLLGKAPKDFDVATNAKPEQIKKLFRNCILIGRRFRLAHIRFGREIIEVATFRSGKNNRFKKQKHTAVHGMLLRDNVYGTLEEDAWRRDFTINALYYNQANAKVIDYCGGLQDIQHRILRIIGDPAVRFAEDPVRLLRTIRFASKLELTISPETEILLTPSAPLLKHVPPARLFEEVLKLFHHGKALKTFQLLQHYHLFEQLFPQAADYLTSDNTKTLTLIELACGNTDTRINAGKTVSPAFLFACFLWHSLEARILHYTKEGLLLVTARDKAAADIISRQIKTTSIPRRYTQAIREIWALQPRLKLRKPKLIWQIFQHPRFRAAYDFLLLRTENGELLSEAVDWWTKFQESDPFTRDELIEALPKTKPHQRKKTTPIITQNDPTPP
jgi:poly(A) polymerase